MLLDVICRRNPSLVEAAIALRRQGRIPANSYVVDLDAVRANARHLRAAGNRHGLSVFAHDQDGTRVTYRGGMRIGNVGHLVQILRAEADAAAALEPECWTVFSDEKAAEAVAAARRGRTQALLGRIQAPGDLFYNGHEGGFYAHAIAVVVDRLDVLDRARFAVITTFPAFYSISSGGASCRAITCARSRRRRSAWTPPAGAACRSMRPAPTPP